MHSFKYLIFSILTLTMLSCDNDSRAIREMCKDIHANYPLATLQDVYKTCYQDYFGAEHLMNDTAMARKYIHLELEQCQNTDMSAMPKYEPTGFRHRFTRINLSTIVEREVTEEKMVMMFIEAAGNDNAYGDDWLSEWLTIEKIAVRTIPAWRDEALQSELLNAAKGKHAVRHSEAFRSSYNPHYRIVRQIK